ncbi:HNH endonuclease signature motif containing protein [Lapillicoccus jejuensis]|uniref:HNH endonuclease signature motif containing protein n=1 Tax=Lapillicoccus jejuensis TaxID=402171 RepID=UPI0011521130|nr:HNH endonuclease signature motif containing protein [Lapillicoccus jejuensis]
MRSDLVARVQAVLRHSPFLEPEEHLVLVHGMPVIRARRHLQLVDDRPTSPGTEPDPHHLATPAPPTASAPRPPTADPSSLLPWVIGVEHPRVGVLLPDAIVRLLADPDTRLRLHGCHPDTDTLTTHDPTTYRPGAALARAVRARDGHCRFPGCTTTATRCQLDHVQPYPTGPTTATNLAALCTGHHRLKTHTPWRYDLHPDGTCTWTSPLGHTYDTHPDRPTDRAA